jgi:phosphatidylserine/phosphatidylglycerophosphate/cardiolipin synthase-like enzyme
VRILVWDMPFPIAASQLFGPHRGQVFFTGSRVKYHLDNTLPASACHHQKVVMVDGSVALVSGGDIGVDRWDTPSTWTTTPAPPAHRSSLPASARGGALVDGKAAEAMAELFIDRWRASDGEALELRNGPRRRPGPRTI